RAYLEAGSDIIETCTFNASKLSLEEFELDPYAFEINKTAAEIARRAAEDYTQQIAGLIAGGVDILLPETSFDTLVLKACLFAIDKYFTEHAVCLPVM